MEVSQYEVHLKFQIFLLLVNDKDTLNYVLQNIVLLSDSLSQLVNLIYAARFRLTFLGDMIDLIGHLLVYQPSTKSI